MIVRIRNAENGGTVDMDLTPENSIQEIIEGVTQFWQKEDGAYVLRKGKKLLRGQQIVADLNLTLGDEMELIPDPEGGAR
ncbi:MAG TPA: hypothetical protein VLH13_02875 [Methanomassiliicoccales archaeon]|nr:hypothetical protein [Methanomassiliicoccales archaeon]